MGKGNVTREQAIIGLLIIGLLAVFLYPAQLKEFLGVEQTAASQGGAEVGQVGIEKEMEELPEEEKPITVIALASVDLSPTISDMLNETLELIDPTMYIWREGATEPTTACTISNGVCGTDPSLAPKEKIEWAAGTDGTYYWEREPLTVGLTDTPLQIKLYSVPGATGATVKVFDTSYNDLSGGATNKTLGAGEDVNLQVQIDVVDEYTAVKRPHICVAYNDSIVNKVKIAGLLEVDAPTRINAALDQCFDTGLDYYTDSEAILLYSVAVDIVSGQNPTVNNSKTDFYIVDKDIWYKNGNEYFVNPIDNSDLGSTTEWTTDIYFA